MTRAERLAFTGALGDQLAALLERPPTQPLAYALFAHCFTCSKDIFAAARISRALAARGIAVLRFDFTGLGHSEGEFANTNFSSNVEDLVRAADHLREHHAPPRILIGHSLGGAAVLMAAERIPEVAAVATIGAPSEPAHVGMQFEADLPELQARGEIQARIAGRPFRIRRQFLDDLAAQNMDAVLGRLPAALLIMHAPADTVVDVDHARRIYQAAPHPKSFVSLDDADHLLGRKRDAIYVADVLAAWSARYLDLPAEGGEDRPDTGLPEGVVRVAEAGTGRYTQVVESGRHRLIGDEPASVGGDDQGPSPYDLLLAALGTCTTMTLRMYAERKELELRRASVELSHRKIHARDCADCESTEGRVDRIERVIRLEGNLTDAQRQRLLEIADRCPVHRTLHSEVKVDSRLEESE